MLKVFSKNSYSVCQILQDPVLAKQKDKRLPELQQLHFLVAKTFSPDIPTHH
jgi:hypothetical protein